MLTLLLWDWLLTPCNSIYPKPFITNSCCKMQHGAFSQPSMFLRSWGTHLLCLFLLSPLPNAWNFIPCPHFELAVPYEFPLSILCVFLSCKLSHCSFCSVVCAPTGLSSSGVANHAISLKLLTTFPHLVLQTAWYTEDKLVVLLIALNFHEYKCFISVLLWVPDVHSFHEI